MHLTARQLCQIVQGQLDGDPDVLVDKPSKIEEAQKGSLSFLANPKYEAHLYTTEASVVLVPESFRPAEPVRATLIRVQDVYQSLGVLLSRYEQSERLDGTISPLASIHPDVSLGEGVSVGPFAVIGKGARIADDTAVFPHVFIGEQVVVGHGTTLYPGVVIHHHCIIGDRCRIHANAVIGSDGFGFARGENGHFEKIAQIGNVVIEDDVEIGANTVIDRATMGSTIIRRGAKLDNLIQVAHNVEIGQNTAIAAQAGIAGSTRIGNNVLIGGQAGFVGHIHVADNVQVQAQSGVAASITASGQKVYGSPALPYRNYLQAYSIFRDLPALQRRLTFLEEQVGKLRDAKDE